MDGSYLPCGVYLGWARFGWRRWTWEKTEGFVSRAPGFDLDLPLMPAVLNDISNHGRNRDAKKAKLVRPTTVASLMAPEHAKPPV